MGAVKVTIRVYGRTQTLVLQPRSLELAAMSVPSPYAELLAAVPVSEKQVTVLGSDTHYWDYGHADAETTIVIAHGYRGEHHGLEPVIAQLSGLRLVSPDLPGFGESSPLPGRTHTIDDYAEWLTAFIEALGLTGTAVVLGHSFGSIVTAHAVAAGLPAPKLILINPISEPATSGPKAILTALTLLWYRAAMLLPERVGHAWLSNPGIVRFMSQSMVKTRRPGLRAWIHDQHRQYFSRFSDRRTVVEGFNASISRDVSMVASKISVPTLLIAAEQDPITTVAAQERTVRLFPNATLVVLPAVGHLIHYEKPQDAARAIVDFLGSGTVVGAAG
jgi:pimeloyl-ACP methyl ester carboxylesterase